MADTLIIPENVIAGNYKTPAIVKRIMTEGNLNIADTNKLIKDVSFYYERFNDRSVTVIKSIAKKLGVKVGVRGNPQVGYAVNQLLNYILEEEVVKPKPDKDIDIVFIQNGFTILSDVTDEEMLSLPKRRLTASDVVEFANRFKCKIVGGRTALPEENQKQLKY